VGEAPWSVRIAEVKALSAVNVDAERTVNKLNEEIKDLIRGVKTRVSVRFARLSKGY
jgi:dynactin 1